MIAIIVLQLLMATIIAIVIGLPYRSEVLPRREVDGADVAGGYFKLCSGKPRSFLNNFSYLKVIQANL